MTMKSTPKHLHIIGICGVLTSALACAFKDAGWKVTGSDKGFFPPASTQLEKHGVEFYAGWHPDKMMGYGQPSLIIAATASGTKNPETLYLREHNIPTISSTEAIRDHLVRDNSIVVAGTWGKTTSSALLSHILIHAGLDPSYMFGGISLTHDMSARIRPVTNSSIGQYKGNWSVLEGDEYKSSPEDPTAKFFYYKPNHLLVTAVSWDHADLYPTEASYFETFGKILRETNERIKTSGRGLIVACGNNSNLMGLIDSTKVPALTYGIDNNASATANTTNRILDYIYSKPIVSKDGLSFTITNTSTKNNYQITSPLLGSYNAENITGCFVMAVEIGIEPATILEAIKSFTGLKRRMEIRLSSKAPSNTKNITVIDDIAHSPEKARYILSNLREIYPESKILAIFEPNIGGRRRESENMYDHAFNSADQLYIPRLTKLKISDSDATNNNAPMEGDELAEVISNTHAVTNYVESDDELVSKLATETKDDDVIVFLGSHGFRGMIESTVIALTSLRQ